MILHVTDLHFNRHWYDWVSKQACANRGVLCITGDLLDTRMADAGEASMEKQVEWVSDWLQSLPIPTFVCSGNHDVSPFDDSPKTWLTALASPKLVTDGGRSETLGLSFACVPYFSAISPRKGAYFEGVDVLLHHEPPYRSALTSGNGDNVMAGSMDLMEYLAQTRRPPHFVLSGHVHKAPNWHALIRGRVHCFNPGTADRGRTPNHILIDTEKRWASYFVGVKKVSEVPV